MKFLCSHCKAKYQISDERVAGRTLRMKCRKCSQDIVISGDTLFSSHPPAPAAAESIKPQARVAAVSSTAARAATGSLKGAAGTKPSGAGTATAARGAATPVVTSKARAAMNLPLKEQWHAAIDNKPTGPMSIQELKEHLDQGSVTSTSLVWRDGFADWMELKAVKELSSLLKPAGLKPPPKPVITTKNALTPLDTNLTDLRRIATMELQVVSPPSNAKIATTPLVTPAVKDSHPPDATTPAATKSGGSLRPTFDSVSTGLQSIRDSLRVRKGKLPFGAKVLLVGAAAFGATLAVLMFNTWINPSVRPKTQNQARATQAPQAKPPDIKLAEVDTEVPEQAPEEPAPPEPSQDKPNKSASTTRNPKSGEGTSNKKLSEQERALLKKFAEDDSAGPSNLQIANRSTTTTSKPLSSSQVRAIVTKHRPMLQRCYEQAAKASGSQQAVRIDVRLNVSPSGSVTKADVAGPSVGNLKNCILSTVKRWRFPASAENTEVPFPLVFQPGA